MTGPVGPGEAVQSLDIIFAVTLGKMSVLNLVGTVLSCNKSLCSVSIANSVVRDPTDYLTTYTCVHRTPVYCISFMYVFKCLVS
jgi:hypothetical protein